VRCADRIRSDAHTLGLKVRAGLHTGAVEETFGALTGMAVHVGARIGAAAAPDEILVSRSVHDLVTGSGLTFADRGNHRLQGVPGRWHLHALVTTGVPPRIPRGDSRLGMFDRAVLRTAKRTPQLLRAAVSVANARQRRQADKP
jgi:class 3 adenylate cyclase